MIKTNKRNKALVDFIEKMVSKGDVTYIEAVIEYCNKHGIQDPGSIKKLIPKPIKEKIEAEAKELNYIKSTHRELPIDED